MQKSLFKTWSSPYLVEKYSFWLSENSSEISKQCHTHCHKDHARSNDRVSATASLNDRLYLISTEGTGSHISWANLDCVSQQLASLLPRFCNYNNGRYRGRNQVKIPVQVMVFRPPPDNCRRIVFATNIAETSVTVDGIVYVVDAGRVKLKAYNPQTGIEILNVTPISR